MDTAFSPAAAIRELSFAWKTLTVYPPGHPAAAGATDEALRQVAGLAAVTGAFVLAIGRDALVIDTERFDGPHAQRLAERLHDLDVGVVRFHDGVTDDELVAFLRLLRPERGELRPLTARMHEAGIKGVSTEAIDLSHLAATDDLETAPRPSPPVVGEPSLWERILGQQLAGRGGSPGGAAGGASASSIDDGPRSVVELVNSYLERAGAVGGTDHGGASDLDRAASAEVAALTARLIEAVGEHTTASLRPGAAAGIKQVAELVGALPRGLREQALDAALAQLASAESGRDGLALLSASRQATEMVSSLRRLRAEGRRLAGPAVEWLSGLLESGAIGSPTGAAARADQLKALLAEPDDTPGWGPEPVALELPPSPVPRLDPSPELASSLSRFAAGGGTQELLSILLDLIERSVTTDQSDAVAGRLEALLFTLVEGGRVRAATALVHHLAERAQNWGDDERGRALRESLERACGATMVSLILDQTAHATPSEITELHQLVDELGPRMTRQLLLSLCEAEDRQRRRQLLDFLRRGSDQVVADARRLLDDSRWFVVRNMVSLLHAMGDRDTIADLRRCLDHSDGRVRIEALRALGELDRNMPAELVTRLLADQDPKVAERMAHLAGHLSPQSAIEPLLALVTPLDPFGRHRSLRIKALLALGEIGDPAVLPKIKRFFSPFSVDALEERRAAFQSLAGYPTQERAALMARGISARDPEIRASCQRLGGDRT